MGHRINSEKEYLLLQKRLDLNLTGAPYSPVFIDILKLVFTAEEAELARFIPLRPTKREQLARTLKMPEAVLREKLDAMAERGLVLDFEHQGDAFIVLAPVVIGFFEFIFMRTRGDLPMAELARLFEEYMFLDDRFARDVFAGETQLARALVSEEALDAADFTEVLDWEKASQIVSTARTVGVSLCACRHKAEHLGKACAAPQKTCLTFGTSAEMLIKRGMAERVDSHDGMRILELSKAAGLAQLADNVKRQVGFICNCCGCCCGMMQAVRRFDLRGAVVTSNWIAVIDDAACKGCGACARACPVNAIEMAGKIADREESLCLGCGVCKQACKFAAIHMQARMPRVVTPETTFDKIVSMALERGKLSNFLFDDPSKWSHRALGRIAAVIEKSPPTRALLAVAPIRSKFLTMLAASKK